MIFKNRDNAFLSYSITNFLTRNKMLEDFTIISLSLIFETFRCLCGYTYWDSHDLWELRWSSSSSWWGRCRRTLPGSPRQTATAATILWSLTLRNKKMSVGRNQCCGAEIICWSRNRTYLFRLRSQNCLVNNILLHCTSVHSVEDASLNENRSYHLREYVF